MSTVRRRRSTKPVMPVILPVVPGLRVSERAFWEICRANPVLRLERSAKGELIVMPPAGGESSSRNAGLTAQLWNWNAAFDLGIVFDSSAGFTPPNTAIRGPDAAWIARDRWNALPPGERKVFSHIAPDFVVELRSESDSLPELRKKMQEYLSQVVRLGWLLDPKTGDVDISRPGREVEILHRPATLSGEDVLPGFVLHLRGIL